MTEKACCENCAFWREIGCGGGWCTEPNNYRAADPAFTPRGVLPTTRWYNQCGLWESKENEQQTSPS